MALHRIYSFLKPTSLSLKIFVCKDRLIFIPIHLVLGKDKADTVAGSELVFNSPIESISLGIHQGIEEKIWLSNAKPSPITGQ